MPSNVAEIYDKSGEHTLIDNTRSECVYPFDAPNWTDLRVGFLLSLTQTSADDTITGLDEVIDNGINPPEDHVYIGIKTNNDALPFASNVGFIGYSTNTSNSRSGSELVTSDEAIGTTNANFWRPRVTTLGSPNNFHSAIIADDGHLIVPPFIHVPPHFAQDASGAGGYATLLMLRVERPNPASHALTVSIKQGTESSDVIHTDTPTLDILEENLGSYPTTVQTKMVNTMAHIPDALYLYWPFHNSRLRCHALGFMKVH